MTLTDHRVVDNWSVTPAAAHDHPLIADFLATTRGLSGRKFAADSRDVAEQLDGVFRDGATVVRDEDGKVRGYTALHLPHGTQPEVLADFVFAPGTPPNVVDDLVGSAVARFHDEAETIPDAFLRAFIGADQQSAIDALVRRGAAREGRFIRTRKPLDDEDPASLQAAAAKVVVDALGQKAASQIFDVGGASVVRHTHLLDRHWRNIRTLISHDPTSYKAQAIGAYHLRGTRLPGSGYF